MCHLEELTRDIINEKKPSTAFIQINWPKYLLMIYNIQSVKCILRVTGYFTVTVKIHEMAYEGQNKVKPVWSKASIQPF